MDVPATQQGRTYKRHRPETTLLYQLVERYYPDFTANLADAGFTKKQAKTGAVTLIQRFGSALNLNIHFHMLFLEGAISEEPWGGTTFTRINTQRAGT